MSPIRRPTNVVDPSTKRYFESMDVSFLANQHFFSQNSLQGEPSNLEDNFRTFHPSQTTLIPKLWVLILWCQVWGVLLQGEKHYTRTWQVKKLEQRVYTRRDLTQRKREQIVDLSQNQSNTRINDFDDPGNIHSPSTYSPNSSYHNSLPNVSDLDIRIAHRKDTHKCVKYPIANFLMKSCPMVIKPSHPK